MGKGTWSASAARPSHPVWLKICRRREAGQRASGFWSGAGPKSAPVPYDQNLVDAEQSYRFFVKLFLGLENRPDPTSDVHELRLSR
jgi:hypothetical protein